MQQHLFSWFYIFTWWYFLCDKYYLNLLPTFQRAIQSKQYVPAPPHQHCVDFLFSTFTLQAVTLQCIMRTSTKQLHIWSLSLKPPVCRKSSISQVLYFVWMYVIQERRRFLKIMYGSGWKEGSNPHDSMSGSHLGRDWLLINWMYSLHIYIYIYMYMFAYKHPRLKWFNNESEERLKSSKGALRYCIRGTYTWKQWLNLGSGCTF